MTERAAEYDAGFAGVRLERITPGATLGGVVPEGAVTVVAVAWHGAAAITLTYRTESGRTGERLLYRTDEHGLEAVDSARAWAFDADGGLFRLVSEARRIRLAHLFDPMLALYLSQLEPLPHQIQAVYGEMLARQPLRFALCDDPGAGKTIMAGLYIKELLLRGDLQRCLVVAPGSLVTQWQGRASREVRVTVRHRHPRPRRGQPDRQPVRRAAVVDRQVGPSRTQRRAAGPRRRRGLGPDRRRRGASLVGALLRRRGPEDQALPARRTPRRQRPPSVIDDRHAACG